MSIQRKKRIKGFTLVEMMVSVGIFTLIVTMGIASLTTVMRAYHAAEKEKKVTDSLDYVLENITREIRLGTNYHFNPQTQNGRPGGVSDGTQTFSRGEFIGFDSFDNRGYMVYRIDGGKIVRTTYFSDGSSVDENLTDTSQVIIEHVHIHIMNTFKDDDKQPLVWIQIKGKIPAENDSFVVQTLVSQRELDAPLNSD